MIRFDIYIIYILILSAVLSGLLRVCVMFERIWVCVSSVFVCAVNYESSFAVQIKRYIGVIDISDGIFSSLVVTSFLNGNKIEIDEFPLHPIFHTKYVFVTFVKIFWIYFSYFYFRFCNTLEHKIACRAPTMRVWKLMTYRKKWHQPFVKRKYRLETQIWPQNMVKILD